MINNPHFKRVFDEPDIVADEVANRVIETLGKKSSIQRIRNSQILSGFVGAIGLALFIVGVEKIFNFLPGFFSILFGLIFLAISGAMLKKL